MYLIEIVILNLFLFNSNDNISAQKMMRPL